MSREMWSLSLSHFLSARLHERLRARVVSFSHGSGRGLESLCLRGATESSIVTQVVLKVSRSASAKRGPVFSGVFRAVLLKIWEKSAAVRGFMARERRVGAAGLVPGQGIEILNRIGEWSEMHGMEKMSVTEIVTPRDKTRSRVWPFSCVGTEMDWVRLKASMRFKKSAARGRDTQQTEWTLKSPLINRKSKLTVAHDKKSLKSLIKSLLYLGGR